MVDWLIMVNMVLKVRTIPRVLWYPGISNSSQARHHLKLASDFALRNTVHLYDPQ